ncbi:MAG: putative multidrug export ATP-binding/permease protein [candidate division BRC1 bacterium ADurb.BinA364]|nr:MAG: putative multidrug export ATP-binding/permease protein [candidate division BRC1 bacterium ADurb.BinA364]
MAFGSMGGGRFGPPPGHHHHHDERYDPNAPKVAITNRRMLGWFYKALAPEWAKVLFAAAAMLAGTAATLYVPLIVKRIFDDVIGKGDVDALGGLIGLFLLFTVAATIFTTARSLTMTLLGQRFVYSVRKQCYDHLMTLGLNYFERQRSGDIMSRVSNDVGAVEDMVVHGTDEIVSSLFSIVGTVAILFWLDWKMALIALAPLPFFVTGLWLFARYIRPIFHQTRNELGAINAKLQERLAGIRVIKAFAREEPEAAFFDESNRKYWRLSAKTIWLANSFFPALMLLTSVGLVMLIWYGAHRAAGAASGVTGGMVVAFISYLQQFYRPIGSLSRVQHMLNRSLASVHRIFELLDEKPGVQDKPDAIQLGRIKGRVQIENVSFRYDTGELVLKDVSVTAEPGETVAIVGRSGAGKSSLINLIARFYDPCQGRVLVDGIDLRDVDQRSLRRNIGMVLQETFLFNASARENILYARPEASEAEVVEAAKRAHAHTFILGLERGYDTVLGELGVRLSGGQKQRIAIARALLADPRILILDEATSMVDTEAEQVIQAALADLMRNRTTFIIAHRLSTVRGADKIVVIDEGQIVEADRHDRLMARGGLYREMVERQNQVSEAWEAMPGLGGGLL